jgi:hypothetical protein
VQSCGHGQIPLEEAAPLASEIQKMNYYSNIVDYIYKWNMNEVAEYCNGNPWFLRRILSDTYGSPFVHINVLEAVIRSSKVDVKRFAPEVLHSSYGGNDRKKEVASKLLQGDSRVARFVRCMRSKAKATLAPLAMARPTVTSLAQALKAWLFFDSELEQQLVAILKQFEVLGTNTKQEATQLIAKVLMAREEDGEFILSSLERGKFLVMLSRVLRNKFKYNYFFPVPLHLLLDLMAVTEEGAVLYTEDQMVTDLVHTEHGRRLLNLSDLAEEIKFEDEAVLTRCRPFLLRLAFQMENEQFFFGADGILALLHELQEGKSWDRNHSSMLPRYSLIFLRDESGEFILNTKQRAKYYSKLTPDWIAWEMRRMIDFLEDFPSLSQHFSQQDVSSLFAALEPTSREAALKARYTKPRSNFSDPILYDTLVNKLKGLQELKVKQEVSRS